MGAVTVRAGGKDGKGEPDPGHFERFCNVVVPDLLTSVCHVSTELAAQISADILARAESYAKLDDTARDVPVAPFAEEVARYEPTGSYLALKGAVAARTWRSSTATASPPSTPTGSATPSAPSSPRKAPAPRPS
jgi:hypothetical protein